MVSKVAGKEFSEKFSKNFAGVEAPPKLSSMEFVEKPDLSEIEDEPLFHAITRVTDPDTYDSLVRAMQPTSITIELRISPQARGALYKKILDLIGLPITVDDITDDHLFPAVYIQKFEGEKQ